MDTQFIRENKPIDVSPSSQAWYTDKLNQALDEYDELQADIDRMGGEIEELRKENKRLRTKRRRTPMAEMSYTPAFETFWKLFKGRWVKDDGQYGGYNKGSKCEAFEMWKKLSEADRQLATKGAPASAGIYTQDCCRWLKYKRWEK